MSPLSRVDMCGMPESGHEGARRRLPPLILHPFSTTADASKLLESTRASLMLQNVIPRTMDEDELETRLLEGRYCEIRMLFYIGRDIVRWVEQCVDFFKRSSEPQKEDIRFQTFMALLTETPPGNVAKKMQDWGVVDFKRVFTRAVGLNCVFADLPPCSVLAAEFVRNYYRYTDHMFACRQSGTSYSTLDPARVAFEVYASGEYSDMLERGLRN
jgi:hypothetical protein